MTYIPILFDKSLDDLRRIGARGGRAYARNCRAHRKAQQTTPAPTSVSVVEETTAQAMATLDAQFFWLRGAERRGDQRRR